MIYNSPEVGALDFKVCLGLTWYCRDSAQQSAVCRLASHQVPSTIFITSISIPPMQYLTLYHPLLVITLRLATPTWGVLSSLVAPCGQSIWICSMLSSSVTIYQLKSCLPQNLPWMVTNYLYLIIMKTCHSRMTTAVSITWEVSVGGVV